MQYLLHIATFVCIYGILAVSLNLVIGYAGFISIAHAAFFGIGAYTTAILTGHGFGFIVSTAAGMAIASIVGPVVGAPSLRVRDDYFVITSFSFQIICTMIFVNWVGLTRGPLGIPGISRPELFGWHIDSGGEWLLFAATGLLIVLLIQHRLVNSPFGRVLQVISEDEVLVRATGRNPTPHKLAAFTIASTLAAFAGSLYAAYVGFVDPSSFTIMDSFLIVCMVIIGGAGTTAGPLAGVLLLVALPEFLRFVGLPASDIGHVRQALYGLLLVVILMIRPTGLIAKGGAER